LFIFVTGETPLRQMEQVVGRDDIIDQPLSDMRHAAEVSVKSQDFVTEHLKIFILVQLTFLKV
jgi:hypothetical protein